MEFGELAMPKRGKHLLAAGRAERAEPLVTYTRLSPHVETFGDGERVEPHLTAVRVDGRGRPVGAESGDEIDTLPLVDAPPSDASLDPMMAEVSTGEIRDVRRRRGPRVAILAGVVALVAGAGVLAAAYNGIAGLGAPPAAPLMPTEPPAEPAQLAAADPSAVDASGRAVRVVSADRIPSASETAALAPRAAADPAAGEAALSDQATVWGEAAFSAEPPGRVIADPPAPRLRPVTASFNPPQSPTLGLGTTATLQPAPAGPSSGGTDVDAALASVDRVLAGERAAPGLYDGSGDDEFYGPVSADPQPLPYPLLPQVPGPAGQPIYGSASSVAPTYGTEPYGPWYPGQEPYGAQAYPGQPQPLYPGVDLAAEEAPAQPWWLPKRRALVIPNAPVPPADIPAGQYGGW
jgi:hypothetical protein